MRILIITENFAPCWAFGGPPKVLFDAARELVRRQHSVTVIATNVLDKSSEVEKSYDELDGVKVYYLKTYSRWMSWNQKIFLPVGLRTLLNKNVKRFHLIILTSNRTFSSFFGYYYCRIFNKPYILMPYGSLPGGLGFKRLMKFFLDPIFGYKIVRDSILVFAQTEHEMEEARKHGAQPNNVKLMPLNIDFSEFEILPPKGNFRRKLGINKNERIVLFLGRLHKNKGIDLLLKSFYNLCQKKGDLKLVIVGRDDGYLSEMLTLIKSLKLGEKAIFVGALYGKDRIEAYVDADVFVLPSSHYEETSTAALEACASATPVILTHQASIPGLDSHNAGLTINYDQEELENSLEKLLDNEEFRINMSKNARKFILEQYTTTAWANRLEEMLNEKAEIFNPEKR